MTDLRTAAQQALEALELGYDAAKSEADQYHAAMAGFRPERHAQMDAEVQQIAAAITALRAALAQQAEPVEPVAAERERCAEYLTQQAAECRENSPTRVTLESCAAVLRLGLHAQAEPVEPWSTRERFHEAVDRAVEAVRQEMKVKTVTMRLPEYDITLPIIDAYSGHVVVGPVVPAPPQRKPLMSDKDRPDQGATYIEGYGYVDTRAVRAVERAHGIGEQDAQV